MKEIFHKSSSKVLGDIILNIQIKGLKYRLFRYINLNGETSAEFERIKKLKGKEIAL